MFLRIYIFLLDYSICWCIIVHNCSLICYNPLYFCSTSFNVRRRQCHPTPVLLPGESHGWRSLVGYSSWSWQRIGHDWVNSLSLFTFMHWRRKWQPTPVFLPGESQGRRSLVGCRLWDRTESDTTSDLAAAAAAGVLLFVFPSLGTRGFCYLSDSPIFAFWSLDI